MAFEKNCLSMEQYVGYREKDSIVALLGYFDGVHLGHQALISEAKRLASELNAKVAVWSFDSLPKGNLITPMPLRADWLVKYGVDTVILDSFDRVRNMSTGDFVSKLLKETLSAVGCVCGYNYHFGKGGFADSKELSKLCFENGIVCKTVGEVFADSESVRTSVSSTLIRQLISDGKMQEAYSLMGHHFVTFGEVIHGREVGRTIGIPTINQRVNQAFVLPPDGVYATYCMIEGKYYPSVTNVGCCPTFSGEFQRVFETHIIGFKGELYGKNIPVGYISRIREEIKFDSPEELVREVKRNIESSVLCFEKNKGRLFMPSLDV